MRKSKKARANIARIKLMLASFAAFASIAIGNALLQPAVSVAQTSQTVVKQLWASGDGTSLSFTDPQSGQTFTLETNNTGKKTFLANPKFLQMMFETGSTPSATVTVHGLALNTAYHLYQDGYKNHTPFTSDDTGSYTFTQDTSGRHLSWIQDRPSTIYIQNTATGGDCASIGTWDAGSATCTLTSDVNESVAIFNDAGITLDCNAHAITGSGTGFGVLVYSATPGIAGNTVKNCHVTNFAEGILVNAADNTNILNNETSGNSFVGIFLASPNNATVRGNNASNNGVDGILSSAATTLISENTTNDNGSIGIDLRGSNDSVVADNVVNGNLFGAIVLFNDDSRNIIERNTLVAPATSRAGGLIVSERSNDNVVRSNTVDGVTDNFTFCLGVGNGSTSADTANNNIFENNTASNCFHGAQVDGSGNDFSHNFISTTTQDGLAFIPQPVSTGNTVRDNVLTDIGRHGFLLSGADSNTITGNTVTNAGRLEAGAASIYVDASNNNQISNNDFRSPVNFFLRDASTNVWSSSIAGQNVVGGPTTGGNHWSDYETSEQGCIDTNRDGVCDSARVLNATNSDGQAVTLGLDSDADGLVDIVAAGMTGARIDADTVIYGTSTSTGSVTLKDYTLSLAAGDSVRVVAPPSDCRSGISCAISFGSEHASGSTIKMRDALNNTQTSFNASGKYTQNFTELNTNTSFVSNAACAVPPSDMVSWWDGDSVVGQTATDIQGAFDGYLSSKIFSTPTVSQVPGKVGQAFKMLGTLSSITSPNFNSNVPLQTFTVDAWVQIPPGSVGPAAASQLGALKGNTIASQVEPSFGWEFFQDNRQANAGGQNFASDLWFVYDNGTSRKVFVTDAIAAGNINFSKWRHLAVSFNLATDTVKFYSNGIEIPVKASQTQSSVTMSSTGLQIGNGSLKSGHLVGNVDEVEIFNRTLTSSEILSVAKYGAGGKCKGQDSSVKTELFDGNNAAVASLVSAAGNQVVSQKVGDANNFKMTSTSTQVSLMDFGGNVVASFMPISTSTNFNLNTNPTSGDMEFQVLNGRQTLTIPIPDAPTSATVELDSSLDNQNKIGISRLASGGVRMTNLSPQAVLITTLGETVNLDPTQSATLGSALLTESVLGATSLISTGGALTTAISPNGTISASLFSPTLTKLVSVDLPAGTTASDVNYTYSVGASGASKVTFNGVSVPYPPGKTITFKQSLGSTGVCIVDRPDGEVSEALSRGCLTNTGLSVVRLKCDGLAHAYTGFPEAPLSRTYTCSAATPGYLKVSGLAFSAMAEFADADDDGIAEAADACPDVAGKPEFQGCPSAIQGSDDLNVFYHTANKPGLSFNGYACVQNGANKTNCKLPLQLGPINDSRGESVTLAHKKIFKLSDLGTSFGAIKDKCSDIYDGAYPAGGAAVVNEGDAATAAELLGVPAPGNYVVIERVHILDPGANTTLATTVCKPVSTSDFTLGVAKRNLKVMKTVKPNGIELMPAADIVLTGSVLTITYPEQALWDETVKDFVYPYIFTSDSDWSVNVCTSAPTGYSVAGVYDEMGNLITTQNCAQSGVANETKVVAFEVVETGSPKKFNVGGDITTKHHGKSKKIHIDVNTARVPKSELEAKEETHGKRLNSIVGTVTLAKGQSLWSLAKSLSPASSNHEIANLVVSLARANSISIPEWGVKDGNIDHRTLTSGKQLKLTGLETGTLLRFAGAQVDR